MHAGTNRTQLLNDKPPARRRLERHLELPAAETTQEPAHALTVRRHDPRPTELPGLSVDPLGRDLRRCWSNPITIVIRGLLKLHGLNTCADFRA